MALDPDIGRTGRLPQPRGIADLHPRDASSSLADILERVLDKGIVIAGDIQINLLDIELITIKIRLLIASVDRAREMGINWWESDPTLNPQPREERVEFRAEIERDNDGEALEARIERLERLLEEGKSDRGTRETAKREPAKREPAKREPAKREPAKREPARRETPTPATRPASARRATGSRGSNAPKR
jgi:Gas vesicle protein